MDEKKTQKALAALAPGELKIVEIAIPEPDDYEVLIKNEGCVFCNTTDRMIIDHLYATPDYPVVIGHECFGRVIKVGKKVKKYKLGDRVICANAIVNKFDGTYHSSWGGFAEYGIAGDLEAYLEDGGVLDDKNMYRGRYSANEIISGDLPYEKAALAFPLAEAASAVRQVGDLTGKTAVIIGAGMVGTFFSFFVKLYGAKKIIVIDPSADRIEMAKKMGADLGFTDAGEASNYIIENEGGADIVFECSGAYMALEKGLPYLKDGGKFATYAVPKQPYTFDLLKCPKNFAYQRIDPIVRNAIDEMCEILAEDKVPVDVFLTHKWTLDQAPEAFEEVRKGTVMKGLVVIS